MALFDFEIDDSYIGKTLMPENGFLVDNRQIRPASHYVAPYGYNGVWSSGYFQIRGSADGRDLICVNPSQHPESPGRVINRSIPYSGVLKVLCIPRGSLWKMTLSDAPLTQREIYERAEALGRKAMADQISAIRGAKSNARTADALLEAARQR